MMNLIKAFKEIWTYPVSKSEQKIIKANNYFGKSENEIGISEFFKSLEVFSKSRKYIFK